MESIDNENTFHKKIEIMTDMYKVMVSNFEFFCSDEWTNASTSERFLKATYDKVLEARKKIYSALEINFDIDINNPREVRVPRYYPIYDECLNIISEYEKKYLEYFEEKLENWADEFENEQAPTEPWGAVF